MFVQRGAEEEEEEPNTGMGTAAADAIEEGTDSAEVDADDARERADQLLISIRKANFAQSIMLWVTVSLMLSNDKHMLIILLEYADEFAMTKDIPTSNFDSLPKRSNW